MRRAVFDTTVLVSAFLSQRRGLSHELLGFARRGEFELVLSTAILLETWRILVEGEDLLALKQFRDISIITPELFREQLRKGKK